MCTNTNGSFICSCQSGYLLDANSHSCNGKFDLSVHVEIIHLPNALHADINECNTNNGGCSQMCVNTNESFMCSCLSGFVMDANNQSCTGKGCV